MQQKTHEMTISMPSVCVVCICPGGMWGSQRGSIPLGGHTVRCAKSWLFSTTGSSVSSED